MKPAEDQQLGLTGLGSSHVGQDPERLGLHVDAAAPPIGLLRVPVGTLDGLIDGGGAVCLSNWHSTATTHSGAPAAAEQDEHHG